MQGSHPNQLLSQRQAIPNTQVPGCMTKGIVSLNSYSDSQSCMPINCHLPHHSHHSKCMSLAATPPPPKLPMYSTHPSTSTHIPLCRQPGLPTAPYRHNTICTSGRGSLSRSQGRPMAPICQTRAPIWQTCLRKALHRMTSDPRSEDSVQRKPRRIGLGKGTRRC